MSDLSGIIKTLQNIMRKDQGVSGDAQRIEQPGWMITLKIIDDKDIEMETLYDDYVSAVPGEFQWRSWAADSEGLTGDALKDFIDGRLFPALKELDVSSGNRRAVLIRDIFSGTNNYMKNGTIIRQVLNKLNEIDFNVSEDRHIFGDIYETLLRDLQSAGNYGEFYTPRAITEIMTELVNPRLGEKVFDVSLRHWRIFDLRNRKYQAARCSFCGGFENARIDYSRSGIQAAAFYALRDEFDFARHRSSEHFVHRQPQP